LRFAPISINQPPTFQVPAFIDATSLELCGCEYASVLKNCSSSQHRSSGYLNNSFCSAWPLKSTGFAVFDPPYAALLAVQVFLDGT
jgi:hypothetical protein